MSDMHSRVFLVFLIFAIGFLFGQWETDVRLTFNDSSSTTSINNAWCIGTSGDTVHVVWDDARDGNDEIYYKRSTNNGSTWGSDIRLTDDFYFSTLPAVAVSGSNVHIVWMDARAVTNNRWEIYYKCSTDGGTTWGTDTRLTDNDSASYNPSVAVSGTNIHVIWRDRRDGNTEIYYKRNPTGNVGTDEKDVRWKMEDKRLRAEPNPFSDKVSIVLSVPFHRNENSRLSDGTEGRASNTLSTKPLALSIKIYDATGRLVKSFLLPTSSVEWNGTDDSGRILPAGVYFVRLESEGFKQVEKVILLR